MQRVNHLEVPKRERFCLNCNTPFKSEMPYFSKVKSETYESWQRQDYCEECWKNHAHETGKPTAFWKSEVAKRSIEQDLERQSLENALVKLRDHQNGKSTSMTDEDAYFLALYLVRKKLLVSKGELSSKQGTQSVFQVKAKDETFTLTPIAWNKIDPFKMQNRLESLLE